MKLVHIQKDFKMLLPALFAIAIIQGCAKKENTPQAQTEDPAKPSQTAESSVSAHAVYDVTGNRVGSSDVYLKGNKFKQVMDVKKDGVQKKISLYSDGITFYMISESAARTAAIKMSLANSKDFNVTRENGGDFASYVEKINTFPTIGTDQILDKKCEIKKTENSDDTICAYNGFPLKLSFKSKGFSMTATKFEPDLKITDEMLAPPANVNYVEMSGDMMKKIGRPTSPPGKEPGVPPIKK